MLRRALTRACLLLPAIGTARAQPAPAMGPLAGGLALGDDGRVAAALGPDGSYEWRSAQDAYRYQVVAVPGPDYTLKLGVMTDIALAEDRVTGAGLVFAVQGNPATFLAVMLAKDTLRLVRRSTTGMSIPVSNGSSAVHAGQWNQLQVAVTAGNSFAVSVNGQEMLSSQVPENLAAGAAGIIISGIGQARFRNYEMR